VAAWNLDGAAWGGMGRHGIGAAWHWGSMALGQHGIGSKIRQSQNASLTLAAQHLSENTKHPEFTRASDFAKIPKSGSPKLPHLH